MTGETDTPEQQQYHVVRNDEEQYSVWRTDHGIPLGWHTVGQPATREECLKWISEIWTDMRPKSLRQSMAATRDE